MRKKEKKKKNDHYVKLEIREWEVKRLNADLLFTL